MIAHRETHAMNTYRVTGVAALLIAVAIQVGAVATAAEPGGVARVAAQGELRHLGIRYANFVTGAGDGLEIDLVRLFAARLGVEHVFVVSDWPHIIPDLLGADLVHEDGHVRPGDPRPRRGDIIATGMTVLPWRQQVVAFSRPTFPTQIWLVTAATSDLVPILPSGDLVADIAATRALMARTTVLAKANTCLAPELYDLDGAGARVVLFGDQLKFMAPAVLAGKAATSILDVPDALVALRNFPGRLKVLGPISPPQDMAAAFHPADTDLRQAYEDFLDEVMRDGTYDALVERYYPAVRSHYPAFFARDANP